ncbi:MAG: alpha-amylase family glycosyl hydrolase [Acidimicrobiales bacterium]
MPFDEPWWKSSVIYQIYPRSFCDTDGDGIGDLDGVRRHLDHLTWLGVDGLWLSPVFPSPMADFGYDVADYCDVDPVFGDLAAMDSLIGEAHDRGLRVLLDWVPNHTSDRHPWFQAARTSRDAALRDFYVWRDPAPGGGPPNNWRAAFGGDAWTFDDATGQYYLHCFLPEQPDLQWANPEVEAAMHDTLRFWIDRGVDGFRMDVIHLIGKDPALPDDPDDLVELTHVPLNHRPETHPLLRRLRTLLDDAGDRMAVGEVYLLDTAQVAEYYGDDDELHLCFNFPPLFAPWSASAWRSQIRRTEAELGPRGAWPTWVLSNHDNRRHRTRYGTDAAARAAAVLLLTLRGTPFLYAGEELGLQDGTIAPDRVVDPGGRDGCRCPIPWDDSPTHGWATEDPWLPWPPEADVRSVDRLRQDPESILWLYRELLAMRRHSRSLRAGTLELLDVGNDDVLAYRRQADGDAARLVLVHMATTDEVRVAGCAGEVECSSAVPGRRGAFDGVLAPGEAVVLRAG